MANGRKMRLCGFRSGVLVEEEVNNYNVAERKAALTAEGFITWVTDEVAPGMREFHSGGYMLNRPNRSA